MARVPIPNPDVPLLNAQGNTLAKPWFDFFQSLDELRVQDLRDIASGAVPADTNTIRYIAASKNWSFGA